MSEIDGAAMLRALARADALVVFAAVVGATGAGAPRHAGSTSSVAWATVGGVSRRTDLPEPVVVNALDRLTQARLIEASPAGDGWHTNLSSLREAAAGIAGGPTRPTRRCSARRTP